ncbi:MAG TPA: hypothetical protein ENO20_12630 [Bacteroides sp.]|nr:hypothetical protein [Bacteroides sp.]
MKLKPSTIDRIKKALEQQGIRNRYLQSEMGDHIACDMEHMLDQGIGEEEAWDQVFAKTRGEEIKATAGQYQGILNARYYRIKLFLWVTFGLFAVSWLFSFRTGQFMSAVSFMAMGTTLILLSLDFFRSHRHHRSNIWLGAGTLLSALLVMSGFILFFLVVNYRVNTHGHSVDLMIFSYVILSLVVFLYFIRQRRLSQGSGGRNRYSWFIAFSGLQLLLAILSFLSLPFYTWAVDYIWILIWVILAVDLISLLLLIFKRIRNILFFVLLTLSFMITFIHSPLRRLLPAGGPTQQTEVLNYSSREISAR